MSHVQGYLSVYFPNQLVQFIQILEEQAFTGTPVGAILNATPITQVMRLVRAPVLQGCPPAGTSWLIAIGLLLALWLAAFFLIRHEEDTIVFFL